MSERSCALARGWIEAWQTFDMAWLRRTLAPDFVHVSPFGRFDDRDTYLAAVEPMARKSVMNLTINEIVGAGDIAVIRFENRTAKGVVETCDWVRADGDRIREIRSFYDTAAIREVLSSDEQDGLDGGGDASPAYEP